MTMGDQPTETATRWRSRAVARSVDPARAAAEARVQRFLDAAVELMNESSTVDFTVQNVVERSGLSLRSFYHHFAGKNELLLALFEESVRTTADYLSEAIDDLGDPLDRLRLFTVEYYRVCRSGQERPSDTPHPNRALGQFAHQLLFDHPREASEAFEPLVSILRRLLVEAAAARAIRSDVDDEEVAGVILQAIMFNAFATTITGSASDETPGRGERLADLLLRGLAPLNEAAGQ
jgi:AcrR family transcriptional regulator